MVTETYSAVTLPLQRESLANGDTVECVICEVNESLGAKGSQQGGGECQETHSEWGKKNEGWWIEFLRVERCLDCWIRDVCPNTVLELGML